MSDVVNEAHLKRSAENRSKVLDKTIAIIVQNMNNAVNVAKILKNAILNILQKHEQCSR